MAAQGMSINYTHSLDSLSAHAGAVVRPAGQAERIEDAIWSLVDSFKIEDYDEAIIDDDKRDKAYDRIRQAVDR